MHIVTLTAGLLQYMVMKLLNGRELADYIQQRQAHEVRALQQTAQITPKLAIIVTVENSVIDVYMNLKQKYGADISVDVDIHRVQQADVASLLMTLNQDTTIHGIIIQLPLADPAQTDEIVNQVASEKDVDGLGSQPKFDPATPLAILWLLAGYNVDLRGKRVLLVGRGKLVGAPLEKMLLASDIDVQVADKDTADLAAETLAADIVITATGSPAVLTADMLKLNTVVIDAGVASEGGKTVGDLAPNVYDRDDLTLTPVKGGVGPLTVCALFENVIRAAQASIN